MPLMGSVGSKSGKNEIKGWAICGRLPDIQARKREEDCLALQADIKELMKWSAENKMAVNTGKTEIVRFNRGEIAVVIRGLQPRTSSTLAGLSDYESGCMNLSVHLTLA
ncbi:hypothetical protein J437_LFUL014883 [Ladona fulva]|uniref:Uncharacterized protein n=1 Tax=Ladona fulva TaxID=123851 RepID=A0A8K0P4I9_LADFU|nr:hypothetical protein J437_LFUL014883 [Ladona fulva]